ncbi:MAG: hypothetical protein COB41_07415 [Proteobacteria bacterium]|nr:MAG: hypothetical protein COB41_07415 [Pseudomonadota bacterium]
MSLIDERAKLSLSQGDTEPCGILKEQVYLLYKPSFLAALATIFAAGFLAHIQWNVIDHTTILWWLAAMWVVVAVRIVCFFLFKRKKPDSSQTPFWGNLYIVVTICAGAAWGSAGVFLFPNDFEHQAATIVILAGMAGGAIATLAALRAPVLLFIILTMLPLIVRLFYEQVDIAVSFAIMCAVYTVFLVHSAKLIYNTHLQNITLLIRSLKKERRTRISEQTLLKTSGILKMIAKGDPASDIYDAIALLYESRHPGLRCSMLELKGNRLIHGGAPSLPKEYCDVVNGLENGPSVGSCGTSTYTGKRVLVENIETDPKWSKIKHFALPHGMRCCWSEPIKDKAGKVLGAFGMYYNHTALPNDHELGDLEAAASLAGIIMERQQREILLEKLHSAFEYAHDAIIIANLDARLEYVNPAFERMTGYSAEESVGKYFSILRSDKHPESFYNHLLKKSQAGEPWQGEIIIKCKDGSFLEVERSVSPVFDKQENILFQVAIQRDMTEQKILEEKFQQAQKLEAIGTLVGGIAHDFNNILAGMTGNLYLAQKYTTNMPRAQKKLNNIKELSFRAADLIKQLLTFARKDKVNIQPLSLVPFFEDIIKFSRSIIPENITVQHIIDENSLCIHGDTTQLHQVLINLLTNARDAVEGVNKPRIIMKLAAFKTDKIFIEKHPYFKSGLYAHLSVQDNGSGISKKDIEHIFEPFFTTKEQGKGTGLGLSMVFGAVKNHHGFIEIDSVEGKGSTFHVYIPRLIDNECIASPVLPEKQVLEGRGELILLVDDEKEVRETGKDVLKALGYKTLEARDGLEAIKIFSEHQDEVALIIMDIVMPKLGGVKAVERIKSIHPNINIIFATGYDKEATFPDSLPISGELILSKPYDIKELSHIIRQKLES